jgi:recombination protein RecA
MPVDPSKLDLVVGKIKEDYGESSIHKGSDKSPVKRIPTGSLALDYATNGGVPLGRWSHLYGGYMSCKTLTCWNIIANAQKMGLVCAYYNVENQFDKKWVAARGIDTSKLEVVEGTTIEDVGKKLEALLGVVHVHVIDSLAAAISVDELSAKLEEWQMGLAARAWGKVFRRANHRFDDNENAIIMVNQVRDTFGYGGGESPPGGRFIEFMSSCSLYFRKSAWLYLNADGELDPDGAGVINPHGDKQADGMEFVVRVAKSRVGPPLRQARLRLDFSTGKWDEAWVLAQMAKWSKVVEKTSPKSSYYKLPDGVVTHDGKETVQGEARLKQVIESSKELRALVEKSVKEAMAA